ncbi:GIY-YIG nuclease family protein [Vibrio ziniensis]|uniref:Bacteriophage T5 Orf172 DNA-binding domain-containing protein n=1 Tax=Vibrio ziniensis TaxID=2711221 RepID=A0A6G7CHC5_9VIBR|nr:GIY-YIG nuclease family protein [Vibrio ziniensis]QIH41436.1 hypothetical protein G5S32_05255 [Vibrio ziniensis]
MGFIYIFTNESMPGLVKVGLTTRSPEERARELDSTGVPMPFRVAASWPVESDLKIMENKCHQLLKEFRLSNNREFFKIEVSEAISILDPHFLTSEQIALEKERIRKKREQQRHYEEQLKKQRIQEKERLSLERWQGEIESLKSNINLLDCRLESIKLTLSQPESLISLALYKFHEILSLLVVILMRLAPFAMALFGFISGEYIIQKLLFAGGFYFVSLFFFGFLGFICIALIGQIERLRCAIFGESYAQQQVTLGTLVCKLKEEHNKLNCLESKKTP